MFCSRLYEWIAIVFLCHVVGLILCVGVTTLGLERMLALFWQSYAKGGVDLDFPQSIAAATCCDRAVSQFDRAVSLGKNEKCKIVYFDMVTCEPCCEIQAFGNPMYIYIFCEPCYGRSSIFE